MPLGVALPLAVPEISSRNVSLVSGGERIGRLVQALDRLVTQDQRRIRREDSEGVFTTVYGIVLTLALTGIIGGLAVFVLPKLEAIFADFDVAMPAMTMATFRASVYVGPLFSLVAVVATMGVAGAAVWQMAIGVTHQGRTMELREKVLSFVPLLGSAVRDRVLADVCDVVGESINSGLPLHRAVAQAAEVMQHRALHRRMTNWANGLEQGLTAHDAARRAGLPALMVGMLGAAHHTPEAASVFAFLSRYYASRHSRTIELLRGAVIPIVVLVFSIIIGWVVLSLFLPLTALITSLT